MKSEKHTDQATFFNCSQAVDKAEFDKLLQQRKPIVLDTLDNQLEDLALCLNPADAITGRPVEDCVNALLSSRGANYSDLWVYFPWKNTVVKILDKQDFITCRTNRNKLKISESEQEALAKKTILFVGLSVGQSAALTFAMQRIGGNYILADFDTLSLTNLNRLRASVTDIGLNKTTIAYRQIKEQDPYINISCIHQGITVENIDSVLNGDEFGKPDLIVEECDSLEMKVLIREKAKQHKIPVIMETSDRGMLDIERFDLESERELFHGMAGDINFAMVSTFSPQQRFELLTKIVDYEKISLPLKESYAAVGKEVLTWPQLGYEVTLGGATLAYVAGKILSGQIMNSGRIYVDLDSIFTN